MKTLLVDGTTLRTSNTSKNDAELGRSSNATRKSRSPLIKAVLLICAGTGAILKLACGSYHTSEQALFLELLESIPENTLLLADRGFASYLFFGLLQQRKVHVLMRLRSDTFTKNVKRKLGDRDYLHEWKRPHGSQSKWPERLALCPEMLLVRVIERDVVRKGYRTWKLRIVTTLTDEKLYPADELARLYLDRWFIETTLRTLKTHYAMSHLTGKTPDIVRKEIYSTIIAHNCVTNLMAESGISPRSLSPTRAREIVLSQAKHMAFAATILLPKMYKEMLEMIATAIQLPQKRGPEPRAIVQRPSTFPVLMTSRDQWKRDYKEA